MSCLDLSLNEFKNKNSQYLEKSHTTVWMSFWHFFLKNIQWIPPKSHSNTWEDSSFQLWQLKFAQNCLKKITIRHLWKQNLKTVGELLEWFLTVNCEKAVRSTCKMIRIFKVLFQTFLFNLKSYIKIWKIKGL